MRSNKKKLKNYTDAALSLLVILGALSLTWAGLTGTRDVPAMAEPSMSDIPESAYVIVIDAGHGGFDGGAVGTDTGVVEAELNLSVAKLIADELTSKGCYVVMTRNGPDALAETKKEDMKKRGEIFNLDNVDLVVSVHMNKFRDRTVQGPMVFYMRGSEEGKKLADTVIHSICENTGRSLRQANPEVLYVLRVPKSPSILVECGFLSNPEDEAKLMTEEYRMQLAKAIADGIMEYFADGVNGDSE